MSADPQTPRAILFGGEKGGSGKSTAARLVLDRLRNREGRTVAAYDGDGSVGQLVQYHGERNTNGKLVAEQDPIRGVVPFDIRDEKQKDRILEDLMGRADSVDAVVLDLPGGALDELGEMSRHGAAEIYRDLRGADFAPTTVLALTPMLASAKAAKRLADVLDGVTDWVVVKNLDNADETQDFERFYGQGKARKQIHQNNGIEIVLPALAKRVYAELDAASLPASAAMDASRSPLGRRDRKHVLEWTEDVDAELDRAAAYLGLTPQSNAATTGNGATGDGTGTGQGRTRREAHA